ncbi:MAG: hypothetical protein IKN24_00725 [Lachnospiraceae bacterium]|nr:hypothetical protein [Lachnospiraceae bacterium]
MLGRYQVRVKNNRNSYSFELKRNITILRGQSGRGKTTLFEMVREYNRYGKGSGVTISCDKEIVALDGGNWKEIIEGSKQTIFIIDEDSEFIRSRDFAVTLRSSDNYFLLITRNYLNELPISVDEIYEITGNKNKKFKKLYQEIYKMYDHPSMRSLPFKPDVIITEDSGAGYQFFKNRAEKAGVKCISAFGKTKILNTLKQFHDENVLIIADGAAFGAEIGDIVEQQKMTPKKLALFLPESFEWIILSSGVVPGDKDKIERTYLYADSVSYMSWEQYYTDLLVEYTHSPEYLIYRKERLSEYYLQDKNVELICSEIKGVKFD